MLNEPLAIDGGSPIFADNSFPWPVASDQIRESVERAIKDGSWGKYESHLTDQLREKLQHYFNREFATVCSSGTIAVELALRGAGVQASDEVVLAAYDFPGNFRAVEAVGARPVLVDVVNDGWVMDVDQLAPAISENTSAIIASHLHGQVADMEKVTGLVATENENRDRKISVVEDACQMPGGKRNGMPLGSFGDVSVLSFGGSKLLSAGRGGAVLTNDADIFQRIKIYSERGNDAFPFSELQAAALIPQFETLDAMTQTRNQNVETLLAKTKKLSGLRRLQQIASDVLPGFYKLPWLISENESGWEHADFIATLSCEGVSVGEGFRGFFRRSPRRCRKVGSLSNAKIAAEKTVLLHHPILLEPDSTIQKLVQAIEKVVSNPRR